MVHGLAGGPAPRVVAPKIALHARVARNRVLLSGTAPPGTATLQGRGGLRLARHHHARGGRRRRDRLPAPGRRVVPLPARRGVALVGRRARDPALGPAPARAPGSAAERAPLSARCARLRRPAARRARPLDLDGAHHSTRAGSSASSCEAGPVAGACAGAERRPAAGAPRPSCAWARARWPGRRPIRWPRASGTSPRSTRSRTPTCCRVPGDPITVAVIDSGIDRTSPDLAGVVPLAPIDEAHDPTTSLVHGTAVAGIIAADADNGIGGLGVGVPYVKLLDYRVVSGGDVDPRVEAQAIRDAVGAGARVINLSLGGHRDPKVPGARRVLARRARRHLLRRQPRRRRGRSGRQLDLGHRRLRQLAGGAAPRDRRLVGRLRSSPGRRSRTPIRSSTTSPPRAWASSRPCPRSLAPTGSSLDAPPGMTIGSDGTVLGTSFSAPHVSAAAAVLLARHPELTPSQVVWILEHTARRLGDVAGIGRDPLHGLRAARRHGGRQARRRAGLRTAAGRRRRAQRRRVTGAGARDVGRVHRCDRRLRRRSPRRLQDLRARRARRCSVRTEGLPLGGNLGLDVGDLLADSPRSREPRDARAREQARSASGQLAARSATRAEGRLLLRAGHRRGAAGARTACAGA